MKRSFAYAAAEAQARVNAGLRMGAGQNHGPLFDMDKRRDICSRKHGGSPESHEAHKTIRGGIQAQRERVYAEIKFDRLGLGWTLDEVSESLKVPPNAISGRFSELARDGCIEKIGRRKTRSGCWAAVWRAV